MRYPFYFTTTANACSIFLFFYEIWGNTCLHFIMFLATLFLLAFYSQLNKRRIFLLRRLVWLSSFYIIGNVYELFFVSQKLAFWIRLFQRIFIFHISFQLQKLYIRSLGFVVTLDVHFLFSLTKTRKYKRRFTTFR